MAIVKNQDIPQTEVEDKLKPPIELLDTYQRVVTQGIDQKNLAENDEMVYYTPKDSKPSQRDGATPGPTPGQIDTRTKFRECLDCWRLQLKSGKYESDCYSYRGKKYVDGWTYVPGVKNPYYRDWMKDCLLWIRANPGKTFWKCDNLVMSPDPLYWCPSETYDITISGGDPPYTLSCNFGTIISSSQWQAPSDYDEVPCSPYIYAIDTQGRRGCIMCLRRPLQECCCVAHPTLTIAYFTLAMQCGQSQNLGLVQGEEGCPPYQWSISGGGSISSTTGTGTTYTAPDSNPSCSLNPTITVTDGCGHSSAVTLAVNCYGQGENALVYHTFVDGGDGSGWGMNIPGCPFVFGHTVYGYYHVIRCDGAETQNGQNGGYAICERPGGSPCDIAHGAKIGQYCLGSFCAGGGACPDNCNCMTIGPTAWHEFFQAQEEPTDCEKTFDLRTPAMIEAGCCPLNPATGLPF